MIPDNVWVCPKCKCWNRNTLEKCPDCGCIKDVDPEAETKIMPPIKVELEEEKE